MVTITVITPNGEKTIEADPDKRLVLAIEDSNIDIGHRCGGYASCTTCRVEFLEGEPNSMTVAEKNKLEERKLTGSVRLSCQILCSQNMKVKPIYFVASEGWDSPGNRPNDNITPDPEWTTKS